MEDVLPEENAKVITMKKLLEAEYTDTKWRWNPKMKKYIYS